MKEQSLTEILATGFNEIARLLNDGFEAPTQRAVIRTVNGEPDDIWIENVDVHLERVDQNVWSLQLYHGDKRVLFSITAKDSWPRIKTSVTLNEDEIGCEREEQGE